MQMNWNPFKSITALESRVESLEAHVLRLDMQLSEDGKAKKALEVLRKARQRDYGRRYYEKRKAMKAAAKA
jgi:hypothetical protein